MVYNIYFISKIMVVVQRKALCTDLYKRDLVVGLMRLIQVCTNLYRTIVVC